MSIEIKMFYIIAPISIDFTVEIGKMRVILKNKANAGDNSLFSLLNDQKAAFATF